MLLSLVIAAGFVLVIEGLLYAFLPGQLRSLAKTLQELSDDQLRSFGLAALGAGVVVIWLARVFLQA